MIKIFLYLNFSNKLVTLLQTTERDIPFKTFGHSNSELEYGFGIEIGNSLSLAETALSAETGTDTVTQTITDLITLKSR